MHAIVSGSDARYFHLLFDLIESIRKNVPRNDIEICVYDFGMTADQLEQLQPRVNALLKPGWDISYSFQSEIPSYKKYVTIAPFTPRYFPGYDIYIWLDADTWFQTGECVDLLIEGAAMGRLAAISSTDRNYPVPISGAKVKQLGKLPLIGGMRLKTTTYLSNTIRRCYSRSLGNELFFKPLINAGVYALHRDAPHWRVWEQSLRLAKFSSPQTMSDQVPLNHAIYTSGLPVELLPAWCNWMCNVCLPAYDAGRQLLVEPNLPNHPISLVHLVNYELNNTHALRVLKSGKTLSTALTYAAMQRLRLEAVEGV